MIDIKSLKIDPVVFTHKFVKGCDISICSGECCYYGVYAEVSERDDILKIKDEIKAIMDDSQTTDDSLWFEEPVEDDDFSSGYAAGTELHNGKCVFLDKQGFCSLQKLAMKKNENKWKYKPLYCILFPLVISEGELSVDDDHLNRMHYCNKPENQPSNVFDVCRDEILHVFGQEGLDYLMKMKEEMQANNS